MKLCTSKFELYMKRFLYWLGLCIGKKPKTCIVGLLLLTTISTLGFLRFTQINNARVTFTAHDSPSHREGAMISQFLRQNGTLHMIEILIQAKNDENLMLPDYQQQLVGMTNEMIFNITVDDDDNKKRITYQDMCTPYCEKNDAFYTLIAIPPNNESSIELTYPVTEIFGKKIFLGNNFYTVSTDDSGRISSYRSVVLRYYLTYEKMEPMLRYEDELGRLFYESNKYPLLNAQLGSDNIVSKEVKRFGTATAPYLSLSVVFLCIFLIICSLRYRTAEAKPLEVCLGAVIPIISGLTTIGLVSATGLAFQSIVVSTLFLCLAIGIDDVFIILSAWHRTDKDKSVAVRIAETVQEAGCSMTVTTITNLVSFGNGVFSSTPILQTFAIYSSVASVVCYIYQIVIFPAIIAITARREYESKRTICCLPDRLGFIIILSKMTEKFWCKLSELVAFASVRIITFSCLLIFWFLAGNGVLSMNTDLSIQKMADKESRIVKFKNDADTVYKQMQSVAVLVHQPGDLRNNTNLRRLKNLIADFETANYSYGANSTVSWLDSYIDFLSFYEQTEDDSDTNNMNFTYTDIPNFLNTESYYKPMMRINSTECENNKPDCLTEFLFTTGYTTLVRYNEMYPLLQEWRAISAKYSELEVFPYTDRSNFADQTHDMVDNIWQTMISEVICMTLSFVLFVPDLWSILAAVFSLISVNLGVFGFLSLWGVGIDPISTSSLLMSIGFSVDMSAHISYHFYQVDQPTPQLKLKSVYTNIGWPTVQGAVSTILAMVPIILCPSYLGMVFLKTVILVAVFGLVHGLIVLPVFLCLLHDIYHFMSRINWKVCDNNQELEKNRNSYLHHISTSSFALSQNLNTKNNEK